MKNKLEKSQSTLLQQLLKAYFRLVDFYNVDDIKANFYCEILTRQWYRDELVPISVLVKFNPPADILITVIITVHLFITLFAEGDAFSIPAGELCVRVTL